MVQPGFGSLAVGYCFHGRYEIVRCLKAGGMGAVYDVLDQKTRRHRALKVMLPASIQDADLRARFGLEATITAGVESDHIVETFDADIDAETGSPFIVMELLKGEDLGATLEARGHLPPEEVVLLLGQLALALDKTHAAGIIHRDLKPENLFATRADDGTPRLKVLDFGIAKVMAQSAGGAKTTRVMGTPLYMSKEQITGDGAIGPAADLYAVAHIAYTLLTGEAYWNHEARTATAQYVFLSTVLKGTQELATVRAARKGIVLPQAFDTWFMRATALEAELRFDRASSMVNALTDALGVMAARVSSVSASPAVVPSVPALAARAAMPVTPIQRTQPSSPSATGLTSDQAAGVPSKRRLWPIGVVALGLAAVALLAVKLAGPASRPAPAGSSAPVVAIATVATTTTSEAVVAAASSAAPAPTVEEEAPSAAPSSEPSTPAPSASPRPRQKTSAPKGGTTPAATTASPKPSPIDPTMTR